MNRNDDTRFHGAGLVILLLNLCCFVVGVAVGCSLPGWLS